MNLVEEFEKEIREEKGQWIEKRKGKQKAVEVELNPEVEEFKRNKLLGKYIARTLFGWDNLFLLSIFLDFIFFLLTMKRHVTLQSHDMSHNVRS